MSLAERLADTLSREMVDEAPIPGDHPDLMTGTATEAAVLVAITDRAEPGVILTQRTETMRRHPGQVAFPGGRTDPGEDAVATALREAEEEVALPRHLVRVAGLGDRYRTGTGFAITPVIGVVPADVPLVASEAEVAAVFEVPLAFLFDPANLTRGSGEWMGATRHFYEIRWGERRIWGATAAMIVNLSRRLVAPL